jgi:MFS family permease
VFSRTSSAPTGAPIARVRRALNPLDGVPSPLPGRRPATPPERAMRNLWWDGVFAESCDVIWLQYFSLYALQFGASVQLIGALAAVTNLLAALSMWPGALLAERTRAYKTIVLVLGGTINRLVFPILAIIPWIATGQTALAIVVFVAAMRGFFGNVAMPAWNAFAGRFVPSDLRGRYFGSRNFGRELAGLATAPLIGLLIYQVGGMGGWQAAWAIAFIAGMTSTWFYARIPRDATAPREERTAAPAGRSPPALRDGRLAWFVAASSVFQLSVMVAGPFFSVYLVQNLGASTLWVGITAAAMPVAGIVSQPLLGRLCDRVGPRRLLIASGLVFPLAPWAWMVVSEPWQVVFINLVAGALWAANLIASLNLVLELAPPDRRPTYTGLQQAGIFFASFVGPLIGGALVPAVGFKLVFFLSGAGRGLATLLLWRFLPDDAPAAGSKHEALEAPPAPAVDAPRAAEVTA